jgi:flagellar assembly factor FliW
MLPYADSTATLTFPDGLVGCNDWKTFVLLTDSDENLPVAYLRLVSDPSIQLLVTDPRLIDEAYSVKLNQEDRVALDLRPTDEVVLYTTLTIGTGGLITANLLGPLVVNPRSRKGRQLVLSDSTYTTSHPVAHFEEA